MRERLEEAVAECDAYIRMGALNDAMIADIAHDHELTVAALRCALGWDADEHD